MTKVIKTIRGIKTTYFYLSTHTSTELFHPLLIQSTLYISYFSQPNVSLLLLH